MLPLNWCHLSDLINKKSQPINALRQVHSFSLSALHSHVLHLLLPCVHPQRSFCCTAHVCRQSSTTTRTHGSVPSDAPRTPRSLCFHRAVYFYIPTQVILLSRRVPRIMICTFSSVSPHPSAYALLISRVPPHRHCAFTCVHTHPVLRSAAYARTFIVNDLCTSD